MAEKREVGPVAVERLDANGIVIGTAEMTFYRLNGHVYVLVNSGGRVQRFVLDANDWEGIRQL